MAAGYYRADTENDDRTDGSSEDGLVMLLTDLNLAGNTCITPAWHSWVSFPANGSQDIERNGQPPRRAPARHPHELQRHRPGLTIRLAALDYRSRPATRQTPQFPKHALVARLSGERPHLMPCEVRQRGGLWPEAGSRSQP
jgi:hypothetical protein